SSLFDPLIYFRCSFSFRHKNTPLDNHIQRGETSQLFYKHRDFVLNIASFLQTSRLYFKPTEILQSPNPSTLRLPIWQGFVSYLRHSHDVMLHNKQAAALE